MVPLSKSSTRSSSFLLSKGSIFSGTLRMAARPIAPTVKQDHAEQERPGHQPRMQQRRHQRIEDLVQPRLLDGVQVVRIVVCVAARAAARCTCASARGTPAKA